MNFSIRGVDFMNKKILFLFILIILSILTTGCSVIGTLEKTGCKLLPAGNLKDHCWQDAAVRLSMPSICYFIQGYKFGVVENSPPMTKCFLRIAEKERDVSYCKHIVEGHPNGYTKNDCYMAAAVAAKNQGFCDLITVNESRGFGLILVSREACYSQVGKRPTYCVGESDQTKCLSAAAISMLDVTICEDGKTASIKQMCLLNAIEGIQQKMIGNDSADWNSAQCGRFNDPNLKYTCAIFAVAAFEKNEVCSIILETQYNEICKLMGQFHKTLPSKYDEKEKDKATAACNKFTIPEFKGACLFSFGHELELTAGNEAPGDDRKMMEKDAIEFYYKGCDLMGKDEKDISPEAGFMCIMMPYNVLEPEYCPEYKEKDMRDFCYTIAAMRTGDCSKIEDAESKQDCKEGSLEFYKAQEKICGKKKNNPEEYKTCQKDYAAGFFMQQLGVSMPEPMKRFMKG
jgi:hypothetical protein